MVYLITEFSKYIMIAVIICYLISSVWPLLKHHGDMKMSVYIRQMIYIFIIHSLSMVSLYFNSGNDKKYLLLYVAQLICVFSFNAVFGLIYNNCSRMLLNHMSLFLVLGFVMMSRLNYQKSVRQFFIICISLIFFMIIPYVLKKMPFLRNYGILYGVVGLSLLLLVFSLGNVTNGSKLSYNVFGLTFQPSEFVKILFVFFISALLYEKNNFLRVFIAAVFSGGFILLLTLSKDLGSALIYYVVFVAIVVVATGKIRYTFIGIGLGTLASYIGYTSFSHVRTRIAVWLDPWTDIDKSGYQITQSLFAIGTGSWTGMGLGKGDPSTIPFVEEDFMFSALCEEYGVIFGLSVILIYLAMFLLLLKITLRCKDNFYRLIIVGLAAILVIQTFLTIGGGTRLIPLTGVTLPLISNGGSSAMSTIILFGICQGVAVIAVSKKRKNDEYQVVIEDSGVGSKRRRNSYILSVCSAIMFLALVSNIIYYMVNDKDEAISNDYNIRRQELLAAQTIRGSILASDGTVLAQTIVNPDGTEYRYYPFGDEYAHVVGYSTFGKTGIESTMNMFLINSNISFSARTENGINGVKNPGDNVYTTLIPALQDVARESLGVYKGAVIVTEVNTGKILAMVSTPAFDPNTIADNFEEISADDESSVFVNRVTQGQYPPGSTFKIITALEYIRENPDNFLNYSYTCNGTFTADGHVIHCFRNNVHGYEDLYSSLGNSCNSSFANIGVGLNRTQFADTLVSLLFNSDIPVAFPAGQSHISMREFMTDDEMVQTAIGQGETMMTPLHLNMITCAIANNGVMMAPYVVSSVENAEGKVSDTYEPIEIGTVMTPEEAAALMDLLVYDVEHGTANKLSGQEYTAAGKTGSAEYSDSGTDSHAWFTGYAPADNPRICVTVILEGAGTGGDYCVPIAKRIFNKYFEIEGL